MVDRVLSELADAGDGIVLVIDDLHELSFAGGRSSSSHGC